MMPWIARRFSLRTGALAGLVAVLLALTPTVASSSGGPTPTADPAQISSTTQAVTTSTTMREIQPSSTTQPPSTTTSATQPPSTTTSTAPEPTTTSTTTTSTTVDDIPRPDEADLAPAPGAWRWLTIGDDWSMWVAQFGADIGPAWVVVFETTCALNAACSIVVPAERDAWISPDTFVGSCTTPPAVDADRRDGGCGDTQARTAVDHASCVALQGAVELQQRRGDHWSVALTIRTDSGQQLCVSAEGGPSDGWRVAVAPPDDQSESPDDDGG